MLALASISQSQPVAKAKMLFLYLCTKNFTPKVYTQGINESKTTALIWLIFQWQEVES